MLLLFEGEAVLSFGLHNTVISQQQQQPPTTTTRSHFGASLAILHKIGRKPPDQQPLRRVAIALGLQHPDQASPQWLSFRRPRRGTPSGRAWASTAWGFGARGIAMAPTGNMGTSAAGSCTAGTCAGIARRARTASAIVSLGFRTGIGTGTSTSSGTRLVLIRALVLVY